MCEVCEGTKVIALPTDDGVVDLNCPLCTKWRMGFGGYGYTKPDGTIHWYIKPVPPQEG